MGILGDEALINEPYLSVRLSIYLNKYVDDVGCADLLPTYLIKFGSQSEATSLIRE